mgnify:CR=1 FL=1
MTGSLICAFGTLPFLFIPHIFGKIVTFNGFLYHWLFPHSTTVRIFDMICNLGIILSLNIHHMDIIGFGLCASAICAFMTNKASDMVHVTCVQWVLAVALLRATQLNGLPPT